MRIEANHTTEVMSDHHRTVARGRMDRSGMDHARTENSRPVDSATGGDRVELSEEAKREVDRLKKIDAQVRAHEQAHMTAGGPNISGGATFQYTRGPDGRSYAVGGEVSIDTSPVQGNPQATLRKAQAIARAALAPMEPSSQDRAVAAQAAQMEAQARMEMNAQADETGPNQATDAGETAIDSAIEKYAENAAMAADSMPTPANQWTA